MRGTDILLISFLAFILIFGLFVLWLQLPGETRSYAPVSLSKPQQYVLSDDLQFYPNMRYPDRNISYFLSSDCDQNNRARVADAFSSISKKTILEFYESLDPKAEISVLCSDALQSDGGNHFIAGEGGPTEIINATKYDVILSGKISLYRAERCKTPNVAIHEILHALGFEHINYTTSIMYPITQCDQQIDDPILAEIDRLYSVPSAPDLIIEDVNASKSGRYFSFRIVIGNYGLIDANSTNLTVDSAGSVIRGFDIGTIPVGTKKYLEVTNLKAPRNDSDINFFVYSSNSKDMDIDNNRAQLRLVVK